MKLKFFKIMVALAAITTTFSSCKKDEKDEPEIKPNLIGVWQSEEKLVGSYRDDDWHTYYRRYTFQKDGSGEEKYVITGQGSGFFGWSYNMNITWEATKNKITLNSTSTEYQDIYDYVISDKGKTLTFSHYTNIQNGKEVFSNPDYSLTLYRQQ